MLTREDDIDVHALRRQGWTISAIARHLGRDRKTIRAYLSGREAGVRATSRADPFDPFVAYCAERLKGDPHLWASTWANTPPRHSRGVGIGRSPGGWGRRRTAQAQRRGGCERSDDRPKDSRTNWPRGRDAPRAAHAGGWRNKPSPAPQAERPHRSHHDSGQHDVCVQQRTERRTCRHRGQQDQRQRQMTGTHHE